MKENKDLTVLTVKDIRGLAPKNPAQYKIAKGTTVIDLIDLSIPIRNKLWVVYELYENYIIHTPEMVLALEKLGINTKDDSGRTALTYAVYYCQTEIVRMLIEKGANIEAKDNDGWTALMYSIYCGKVEIVRMLIEKGANIEARDDRGRTPVMHAGYLRQTEIVRLLIEKGAESDTNNVWSMAGKEAEKKCQNKRFLCLEERYRTY